MKTMNRRNFLKVAGMSAAGATLAACAPAPAAAPAAPAATQAPQAPAPTTAAEPTTAPAEKVTLRFASWDSASGQDVYNGIVNEFKKANPNVDVKVEFTPDGYDDKILTGLAGGSAPDTFMWWNYPGLMAKKGILDLTEYAKQPGDQGLDPSAYYPEVYAYANINGVLVGTPNAFTPRALFYNKKLFKDANVPEPTDKWTWDDLLDAATKLTKGEGADKVYGIVMEPGTYHTQPYVWSNGGDYISPDGTKASGFVDSKETMETVQWLADLVLKHKVSPVGDTISSLGGTTQMFQNGKLAMMDNGRWPQTDLMKTTGLEFGLALPPINPKTNKRISILHTSAFCVNPATSHKDEAWRLVQYLGGPVGNKQFGQAGWAVPALPSVVKELGWETDPIEKIWIEAIPFATVQPCFMRTTAWAKADTEFANALQSIWLGQATTEEALKKVAPVVDDILAKAEKL